MDTRQADHTEFQISSFSQPFKSPMNNYRRSVVCAQCGDKTWLTSAIGTTRSADLQCHLPRKTWRSSQRPIYIITSTTTS